jgi:hypothetical protein
MQNHERKWANVDEAIDQAAATLRDVADRLEAGPRQRAAEVLMRRARAIEELSRETDRLLPAVGRGGRWLRWLRFGRRP